MLYKTLWSTLLTYLYRRPTERADATVGTTATVTVTEAQTVTESTREAETEEETATATDAPQTFIASRLRTGPEIIDLTVDDELDTVDLAQGDDHQHVIIDLIKDDDRPAKTNRRSRRIRANRGCATLHRMQTRSSIQKPENNRSPSSSKAKVKIKEVSVPRSSRAKWQQEGTSSDAVTLPNAALTNTQDLLSPNPSAPSVVHSHPDFLAQPYYYGQLYHHNRSRETRWSCGNSSLLDYNRKKQNHKRMLKALFEEQIRPYYGIYDFIIYTDGSFYHHQQKGGAGIVFEINDARNCSIPLPMAKSSIDAEALAILHALSMIMCNASVVICTDCLSVIDGVNHGTADCSYIRQLKLVIALRPGITKLMKVPAHAGVVGNEMADHLAKLGSHQAFSLPVPN